MRRTTPIRSPGIALALMAAAGLSACAGGEETDTGSAADAAADARTGAPAETAADTLRSAPGAEARAGSQEVAFEVREGRLIRSDGDGDRALLALDSAAPAGVPVVPASWQPAPGSTFGIRATSFRHAVASPGGRWVAWEAGSTHDLVGVVPADGGPVTVLDFYFDSSAEELIWAPGGRYLAARYLPPSGMQEVRVYDAHAGTRLRAPWEQACRPRDGCRVTGAEWTGAATLVVTTADGEERRHEADVAELPARSEASRAD